MKLGHQLQVGAFSVIKGSLQALVVTMFPASSSVTSHRITQHNTSLICHQRSDEQEQQMINKSLGTFRLSENARIRLRGGEHKQQQPENTGERVE